MGDRVLYGRNSSCNVQKAMWVLQEAGVDYEHIELGGDFGGLDDPAFRAMNPHGKVPVLKDGDTVVWESDAIVRYVAATYAVGSLWPEDPAARAVCDQWMCWTAAKHYPDWIALFWKFVRRPPGLRNQAEIDVHHAACVTSFTALDRRLGEVPYLAGEHFTMADVPAGMTLYRWFEMDIERPAFPNVEAWYARLRERPAYRKAVCVPFDDLVGKTGY